MKFGNWLRGREYVFTSNGCDDDGTAFCGCDEGALGTGWVSCDHATGTVIIQQSKNAVARRMKLLRAVLGIRFISIYQD